MNLKIVLEPSEDGGYTVYVPALPGCVSEGDTKDEAMTNIKEAISLYLEPAEDDTIYGESVPAHKPVKRSTLGHILKQAEIEIDQFLQLL